jgi:hypothetical protein
MITGNINCNWSPPQIVAETVHITKMTINSDGENIAEGRNLLRIVFTMRNVNIIPRTLGISIKVV